MRVSLVWWWRLQNCSSVVVAVFVLLPLLNYSEALTFVTTLQMSSHRSSPPSLKVAIIGAGASGLAVARAFSKRGIHPTIFEKAPTTGGVWNYSNETGKVKKEHPMYRGLRTNLPKEIMAFRELPWTRTLERSYVTFGEVLDYLRDYERIFDLTKYINFGCYVTQLTVLPSDVQQSAIQLPPQQQQNGTNVEEIWPRIQLEWQEQQRQEDSSQTKNVPLTTSLHHQDIFDAVVICNGHYAIPSIPNLPGLQEYFHGTVLHSIEYDDPSVFAGQKVLCVGGRASGSDLAREISQHADHVYLSDTSCSSPRTLHNMTLVPRTERVLPTGQICFEGMSNDNNDDNDCPKVDTIIFCSGYDYNFPFINKDSNLPLDVGRGERRAKPVFEQLWHAVYPNIAFIGLPHSILPFPLFEFQAQAICHQWMLSQSSSSSSSSSSSLSSHDALQLPPLAERQQCAERDANSGGSKTHGRVPQDTHYLGSAQWDYCRRMAQYTDAYDQEVERYIATNKAIYDHSSFERKSIFPGGPDVYRETRYRRINDDSDDPEPFRIVATSFATTTPDICVNR